MIAFIKCSPLIQESNYSGYVVGSSRNSGSYFFQELVLPDQGPVEVNQ